MRLVSPIIALLGLTALAIAVALGFQAREFERDSMVARGSVTRLNAGPLHADVEVVGVDGRRFVYAENNSRAPLMVGQKVAVRYLPSAPAQTARIATVGVYSTARDIAIMGWCCSWRHGSGRC